MEKVKILVACHKPGKVYQDEVYTPIHVGRAISNYKDEMADMIGDDTGDNISDKNPMYCELTAQYWAWKNLPDVEYIGFCHYRRYFDLQLTSDNVDTLFKHTDVIVLSKCFKTTMAQDILRYVSLDDLTIFLMVLKQKYPEYEQTALSYLYGNKFFPRNMLICRKSLFDEYASWLFDILSACEQYMRPSGYSRARRAMGYLGEYFMAVYMLHHHLRVRQVEYGPWYGQKGKKDRSDTALGKIILNTHHRLYSLIFGKPKSLEGYYACSKPILLGLQSDGILDAISGQNQP